MTGAFGASMLGLISKMTGMSVRSAMGSSNAGEKKVPNDKYKKTIKTDVVVLGCGASGMTAAIRAKQQGVENVLILEKRSEVGGNSVFAPVPIIDDAKISKDVYAWEKQVYNSMMEKSHWRASPDIVGTMVVISQEITGWLKEFAGNIRGGERNGTLTKIMKDQCNKLGIQIICNTRARKLIKDGKGKSIIGVLAEQKGEMIRVDAKATVIATGGFLGDPELMEKYFPYYNKRFFDEVNIEGNIYSGDGMKMAVEAGAFNDGTVTFVWSPNKIPFFKGDLNKFPTISFLTDNTRTPESLWVNKVPIRYTNEAKLNAVNGIYRQPHKESFIILDAGIVEHVSKKHPGIVSVEKLEKEIKPLIEADQALITDSIFAIADWIGGGGPALRVDINTYNACCDKGYDDYFFKDSAFLVPFRKPPFYVFRSGLSLRQTQGAIRVNPRLAVIYELGNPFGGLMACGADIGQLYGDLFISSEESHSIEWAIASGIAAGECAAMESLGFGPSSHDEVPKYTAKEIMSRNYENVDTETPDPDRTPLAIPIKLPSRKSYH